MRREGVCSRAEFFFFFTILINLKTLYEKLRNLQEANVISR